MLKFLPIVSLILLAASGASADHHVSQHPELEALIEQNGPEAALIAGMAMAEAMSAERKKELYSRIPYGDRYDICRWCDCCKISSDGFQEFQFQHNQDWVGEIIK